MNPPAPKVNPPDLNRGGTVIVDTHDVTDRNLKKVGYAANPLEDGSLDDYIVHAVDLTTVTVASVEEFDLGRKDAARAKNMFALGLVSWKDGRDTEAAAECLPRRSAGAAAPGDAPTAAPSARHKHP